MQVDKTMTYDEALKVARKAIDNPDAIEGLLLSQIAFNPRAFKVSDSAAAKIESCGEDHLERLTRAAIEVSKMNRSDKG